MEKIILMLIKNSGFIFLIIFIFCFLLPIILKIRRTNKVIKHGAILTRKTILVESNLHMNIFKMTFLLMFVFEGTFVIYLGINNTPILANKIAAFIFGGVFIIFPLLIIIKAIIKSREILNGNYVIVEDILRDKEEIKSNDLDTDGVRTSDKYYFFFENYFKKYNKKVLTFSGDVFHRAKIGDKFYLVFTKTNCFAFNSKDYELNEKDKIILIDDLSNYINIEKFEQNNKTTHFESEKIVINELKIKKDFKKLGHGMIALVYVLCCIAAIITLVISIFIFKNLISIIFSLILTILFIFLAFKKIKYVCTTYNDISKGLFKLKEDEVISLNNQVPFKDSNDVISFKFKNYKKIIYADKKDYYDTKIGDKFYLIFVKGEEEPIGVYNANNSIIEK